MDLYTLGCGSARPTRYHLPSAHLLNLGGHLYLFDAGEGVQYSLLRGGHKLMKLEALCITHHHGDHCFGLAGLLTSLAHLGRTRALTIVTTDAVAEWIDYLRVHFLEECPYPLRVVAVAPESVTSGAYIDDHVIIDTLPLVHRVPAVGFRVTERVSVRRINPVATKFYQIPNLWMQRLQAGFDYIPVGGGDIIPNHKLTYPGRTPRRFAYLSDTRPAHHLIAELSNIDLLYHEATYDSSLEDRAQEYGHSTAKGAAEVAYAAGVGRLIIGHYSGRYESSDLLLEEARSIFPQTEAAAEGCCYTIPRP